MEQQRNSKQKPLESSRNHSGPKIIPSFSRPCGPHGRGAARPAGPWWQLKRVPFKADGPRRTFETERFRADLAILMKTFAILSGRRPRLHHERPRTWPYDRAGASSCPSHGEPHQQCGQHASCNLKHLKHVAFRCASKLFLTSSARETAYFRTKIRLKEENLAWSQAPKHCGGARATEQSTPRAAAGDPKPRLATRCVVW